MEEKFQDVLEKNEKIVTVFKPDKIKFWVTFILSSIFSWVWVFFVLFVAIDSSNLFGLMLIISGAAFVGGMLLTILFGAIYYNNRFYAFTSKRIIIRGGIIGIDYKSLEFKALTATIVNVTFVDKILARNTGNLRFGSPASPVGSTNNGYINPYVFKHIVKPYDTLREIKELIDATEKAK